MTEILLNQNSFALGNTRPFEAELGYKRGIPLLTDDEGVLYGSFATYSATDNKKAISTGITASSILFYVDVNIPQDRAINTPTYTLRKGTPIKPILNGYVGVIVTNNNPSLEDKVFLNTNNLSLSTGTGTAPSGSIDTGWIVSSLSNSGNVIEIKKI